MPKKTRKAKLIAEYRRKLQRHEVATASTQQTVTGTAELRPTYSIPVRPTERPGTPTQTVLITPSALDAIKRDLLRTLGIVSIAIVCELVLWRYLG